MISYEGLEKALKAKGIGKTELSAELGLSSRTIAKIAKVRSYPREVYKRLPIISVNRRMPS